MPDDEEASVAGVEGGASRDSPCVQPERECRSTESSCRSGPEPQPVSLRRTVAATKNIEQVILNRILNGKICIRWSH